MTGAVVTPGAVPAAAGASLAARISLPVLPPADEATEAALHDLVVAATPDAAGLPSLLERPEVKGLLQTVLAGSPYLKGLIVRDPVRLARLLACDPDAHAAALIDALKPAILAAASEAEAMKRLRDFKSEAALLTALADLGNLWTVMRVTEILTKVADAAVQAAVGYLFVEAVRRGQWLADAEAVHEARSGYIVLGMGKYGAFELNYSSDIDLIVFFDAPLARVATSIEVPTFFVRLTRDLVRLISEPTRDGYVFRTDLRLRPDPGATQVALSTDAAYHYYETVGQNWERAALIKARPVAGDIASGEALLGQLAPFIWRKYLDFAAIHDIHAMKRQIHAHKGFASIAVAGHNIKLGAGGIREIEFFAQTQQLIAGGRQPDLRTPRTLDALAALAARGWTTTTTARELSECYLKLRAIEHRLQMVADQQTHIVPLEPGALARFARFAGFASVDAFSESLTEILTTVQSHYAALFEKAPELTARASNMVFAGKADDPATVATLAAMGFSQPSTVLATVRAWHHGRARAMRSPRSRERLTEVQPLLIEALAQTADPDAALANFDRFLFDLPAGVQLFALLRNNTALLRLLADIMGSAPRLARILSRRSRLFDAVLDAGSNAPAQDREAYARLLSRQVQPGQPFEVALDEARVFASEQQFLIGVSTLSGVLTAEAAGRAYAALAEAVISLFHSRIVSDIERQHGRFPGGGTAVVALGKLGGREMTANSDLDLIVVYDVPEAAMTGALPSDGPKPLPAPQYFARLTQRLVSALTVQTAEGTLYDVDLRLRPSGQKGPLATSLAGFMSYQASDAWTWEHMALTRARVISGGPDVATQVTDAITEVLRRPREAAKTAHDVASMRERIAAEKGCTNPWDLKYVRGGLIDVEFICQYLQLIHAAAVPAVLATDTRAALSRLAAVGILAPADAEVLRSAAGLYSSLIGTLRLMADGPFAPATAPRGLKARLSHVGDAPTFDSLEATVMSMQREVLGVFQRLFTMPPLA